MPQQAATIEIRIKRNNAFLRVENSLHYFFGIAKKSANRPSMQFQIMNYGTSDVECTKFLKIVSFYISTSSHVATISLPGSPLRWILGNANVEPSQHRKGFNKFGVWCRNCRIVVLQTKKIKNMPKTRSTVHFFPEKTMGTKCV